MQKFNILYGKEIPLDDKINNSFFLYHTIYTNHSNESINPISFSNNTYYSAVLYYLETDSFSLELYQNLINSKTQEIKFRLKNKIKLNPSSLEYVSNSEDVIKMYFISEKYLLIENILKKAIILDIQNGEFTTIILKGKKSTKKNFVNMVYNPGQNSIDDLFKDDSFENDKKINNKNINNINDNNINEKDFMKLNKKKDINESIGSNSISGDNLNNQDELSYLNENFSNLKILYTYDEFYQQYIVDKPNQNQNPINMLNLAVFNSNDNSMTSNNILNTIINPSPINASNNNSFIFSKKYNQNLNKNPNQNHCNNLNTNTNTENIETIYSNDVSGNDTKKNTNANTINNFTTLNTNLITTLPSSNQNTIDETKIIFNNKPKKITLKRTYIFMMDKNQLYYCIIDNKYDLNQVLEFKPTAFILDENEIIDYMKIIKVNKEDKICYIIFLLSKSGLIIIPTDFCRTTLKNIIINNGFNRANNYKLYYKLDYAQDPLNYYHMAINHQIPEKAEVYILNNNSLIKINLNLFNLKNFIKEELYKLNSKSNDNDNDEVIIEEKIELENNNIAIINKAKKIISFSKQNYEIKQLKILGYITSIKYMDGNFLIYDKKSKSLAIYYFNGEFLDKVENYKDVDLIFFFSFPKIYTIFFCMNNTFNKVSFNKKLYWYSQYFNDSMISMSKKSFIFTGLKIYLAQIKEKYINGIFNNNDKDKIKPKETVINKKRSRLKLTHIKRHCKFCRKEITTNLDKEGEEIKESKNEVKELKYYKCLNDKCESLYCSEMHRDLDFKSFHFFHCKLKQFFINYKYSKQINLYNDLIILINDIIKYIFNNIKLLDDYLFFLPFIRMIIFILKSFNMREISDRVIDLSQKLNLSTGEMESLLFYQEIIFYYYNLILLFLNFGQRCNLFDFVKKELDFLSEDDEQFFSKYFLASSLFKRNISFYQEYIDFSNFKNYFFVDDNYLMKSKYLRQNDILFSHVIHLYSNYLHLIDILCKENRINIIYFNNFINKLLSQLMTFFHERNKESHDIVYIHFLSLITPYYVLNRKMILSNKILNQAIKLIEKNKNNDTIIKIVLLHNSGLIQYSLGMYLEGIHNIERSYNLITEKDYSYLLGIKIIERLALAYLNIGELLKSFVLIKQAIELRTNLINLYEPNSNLIFYKNNSIDKNDYLYQYYYLISKNISDKKINYNHLYKKRDEIYLNNFIANKRLGIFDTNQAYIENSMKLIHLFTYINYIQDFIEYENQLKLMSSKVKKKGIKSKRDYQLYLINYVLAKDDFVSKNENFSIIDIYCDDYFRAIEFLYSLNKNILARLDSDNQTKNEINKEEENIYQYNLNNKTNKLANPRSSLLLLDENNIINNKKNNKENINNNINKDGQNKHMKEKEKKIEYDNEIEIKEDLYDKLSRNEKSTLISINTKILTRKNLLRDYFGNISKNNVNYHPIYTDEFRKIISSSKHQFFVKKLTQANAPELTNYFFPSLNTNLEGLSRYLQQEEIQNMFKVEKAKILSVIQNNNMDNKKINIKDSSKNNNIIIDKNIDKNREKKEQWITNIKTQLLKDPSRSLPEIDISLSNLYDNLDEEYKKEIYKNPELVLYYIFVELSSTPNYTTAIELKKNSIHDDLNIMTKMPELYYTKIKGPLKDTKFKRTSFYENLENENMEDDYKNKRKLNLYEFAGIAEERRLAFSDNSSSSENDLNREDAYNFDFDNINNNSEKENKKNNLESMKEVSESAEGEGD